MNITDREQNTFLAVLNGEAGRYEATKRYIKTIIESGLEPSDEERKLFSIAYGKLLNNLRTSWRAISAVEIDQRANNGKHLQLVEEARRTVEAELEGLCDEVINLVDKHIYPSATTDETFLFCLRMKGDFNRYSAECTSEEKRPRRIEMAASAYSDAVKLAQMRFDAGNSIRMSVIVNAAVFYYDMMGMHEGAMELTETELSRAAEALGRLVDKDVIGVMNLLKTNLQLWKAYQKLMR